MKILFAEDERMLNEAVTAILTRNNYTVVSVYNGEDALDYLLGDEFDAAVLDIMMPKKDGLSVLKEIRAEGKQLPVLLLTAKSEISDRVEGLDAGADDYLPKPFDAAELLARLRSLLRRQPVYRSNVLTFEDISLDLNDYVLKGPQGEIRMTNKEFQMMELFLRNPGQVISTERFMEKIWGYDSDTEMNVVWVYISALRKKLKEIGSAVTLKASRGLGYALEAAHD
ncbi:MAG: response regulator transcription factor [Erysipelotrichaceae bacterium]|nr:response regulator transcription factor [Erysipelotrichaceae bacterium]